MMSHTKDLIFKSVMAHYRTAIKMCFDMISKGSKDILVDGSKSWPNTSMLTQEADARPVAAAACSYWRSSSSAAVVEKTFLFI